MDDPLRPFANEAYASLLSEKILRLSLPSFVAKLFNILKISTSLLESSHLRRHFYEYVGGIKSTATRYSIDSRSQYLDPIFDKSLFAGLYSSLIESIGWNPAAPIVCIHARGSGYSPTDDHLHSLRNVPISSFIPAIEMLISKGINVVRMGDSSMFPLVPRPGLFDYAVSSFKNDVNDLVLSSNALFFLGTPSGAFFISYVFGVPISCCNHCLPIAYSPTGRSSDLGMPKIVKRISTNELVHFEEVFSSGISEWRISAQFEASDYSLLENTPQEICDFAEESFLRHTGAWVDSDKDKVLQERFSSFIKPGSHTYGTSANCSRVFMRKYSHLILD